MKIRRAIGLVVLISATFVPTLAANAAIFFRSNAAEVSGYRNGGWENGYYDPAWGMPLGLVVPPTARWQTDYSWGVGGTRISPIGSHYQSEYPGPESAYNQREYLPAPSQPSDTQQMGEYYVRGRRR